MPYETRWVDAGIFGDFDGMRVYRVYKDDDIDQGARLYWYTLNPDGSDGDDHGHRGTFDVRYLPNIDNIDVLKEEGHRLIIHAAVKAGYFNGWEYEGMEETENV